MREVDALEHTWFPRTHAILRRVVPQARRDAFEASFFKNLEQQPLGPGVILSVSTFLSRLDGLAQSTDPDAGKVRQTLQKRGLTEEKLKEVRGMLKKLEGGGAQASPKVSREELRKAHEQQREGLSGLRDWYNDWATTFRDTFNVRAQIKLGLTSIKRSPSGEPEGEAEGEPAAEGEANRGEEAGVG